MSRLSASRRFFLGSLGLTLAGLSLAGAVCAQTAQLPSEPTPVADAETATVLPKRGWHVTPSVSLDRTYTDNVLLQPNGSSDVITRLIPRMRIDGQSARAKGSLDFRLQQISYANTEGRDRTQRYVNGKGTIELVDQWMFLDLSSNVTRMPVSAFAPTSTGTDSINPNVVETRNYRVSPYVRGHVGNFADYLVRMDNTRISSSASAMRSISVQGMQFDLSGKTSLAHLGWRLNADTQQTTMANGTRNDNNSMRGTLTYTVVPQLKLSLIGGEETQNFSSFNKRTSSIDGAGFEWSPTERTSLGYTRENRYFGAGHTFNLTHRTPRTAWRVSDRRDVQVRPPQVTSYSTGTYYDLFYDMYESTIPDPADRARFVETLMQQLQIPLDAQVIGGALTSRASINRAQEVSFTLSGVRNTVTVSAQRTNRTSLSSGVDIVDDFTQSTSFQQQGLNFNWSHRLTPTSSLALMVSNTRSQSSSNAALQLRREMVSLMLNGRLGAYTNGSIGLRRTDSAGNYQYIENAVIGSLVMTF